MSAYNVLLKLARYLCKWKKLSAVTAILILAALFMRFVTGISGTVVDAQTGRPIEGAVVLAEWTSTKGLGLTYTTSYKVVETLTDKKGRFSVSGVANPLLDPPDLTIYKKGYVAWNNQFIFPDYRRREDFKWASGVLIALERFDEKKYTYDSHTSFIGSTIRSWSSSERKSLMKKAYEWEEDLSFKERRIKEFQKERKQ